MQYRRQPRSNQVPRITPQALNGSDRVAPLARIFSPSELDLDDLAEAIRSLLEHGNPPLRGGKSRPPRSGGRGRPGPDLLSSAHRGTHVVEAPGNH